MVRELIDSVVFNASRSLTLSATDVGKLEQENARLGVALSDAYGVLGNVAAPVTRGSRPARHQVGNERNRSLASSRAGMAVAPGSGRRTEYQGCTLAGASAMLAARTALHPIFQPNSDETHRFRCLVSSERFNLTGIGGHQEDRDPVAVGAGRGARARGLPAGKRGRGSRQPPDAESRAPLLKQCESRPEAR